MTSMTKKFCAAFIFLALVLAACVQSSQPPAQNTPKPLAQPTLGKQPICYAAGSQPTPDLTQEAILPPTSDKDWSKGPKDAGVTIINYCDFQSQGCAVLEPLLTQLAAKYPDSLRIVYRHYPLSNDDKAALAAQAAEAAGLQGKFWDMHDLLFGKQDQWVHLSPEDFQKWSAEQAGELGLNVDQFTKDLTSEAIVSIAKQAWERNSAIGMPGTPFLVMNGTPYNGPVDSANLTTTIDLILLQKRQFSACPPMTIDSTKQYFATLQTDKGNIKIELYADKAPMAVNSFVFLARQGWFDGVTFHRVIPQFVAQAGDPSGSGYGGPGYTFDNEISPGLKFDSPGVVAMANAGPGSNGSQFFITLASLPKLNGGYTIFGRVTEGIDVVNSLTPRDPSQSMGLPPGDKIIHVTIEEK